MRAAIVSTYPPRACGIGAFSADLRGRPRTPPAPPGRDDGGSGSNVRETLTSRADHRRCQRSPGPMAVPRASAGPGSDRRSDRVYATIRPPSLLPTNETSVHRDGATLGPNDHDLLLSRLLL